MLASFALAVQFLTRIPLNIYVTVSNQRLGQSVLFYPLVGLLIGMILILIAKLLPGMSLAIHAAIIIYLGIVDRWTTS